MPDVCQTSSSSRPKYRLIATAKLWFLAGTGQLTTEYQLCYIYMATFLLMGILASAPSRVIAVYCSFAMFFNLILFFSFSLAVLIIAPTFNTADFVFRTWDPNSATTGIHSNLLSFLVACNMAVNALSGYDAVIYMTEETHLPTFKVPAAMLGSFALVAVLGAVSLVMMLFSIQDPDQLLSADAVFGGSSPVCQILWDVMEARFQSGSASACFMVLMASSLFLICVFLLIGTSRKVYAMSRWGTLAHVNSTVKEMHTAIG